MYLGYENSIFMNRLMPLWKSVYEMGLLSCMFPYNLPPCDDAPRRPWTHAVILILDFTASRVVNQDISVNYKCPSLWYFVIVPQMPKISPLPKTYVQKPSHFLEKPETTGLHMF
jgi:hypothetical protein